MVLSRIPDTDTCDRCGDYWGHCRDGAHLVSPGKLALLRWHSLFKGLLETRASRDFHGRKSSVRPGPLAQADF